MTVEPKIARAAAELSRCLWKISVAIASTLFVSIPRNGPHAFELRTRAVFASEASRPRGTRFNAWCVVGQCVSVH